MVHSTSKKPYLSWTSVLTRNLHQRRTDKNSNMCEIWAINYVPKTSSLVLKNQSISKMSKVWEPVSISSFFVLNFLFKLWRFSIFAQLANKSFMSYGGEKWRHWFPRRIRHIRLVESTKNKEQQIDMRDFYHKSNPFLHLLNFPANCHGPP